MKQQFWIKRRFETLFLLKFGEISRKDIIAAISPLLEDKKLKLAIFLLSFEDMPNELAKIKIKKALAEASLKFQSEKFCNEENFLFQKLKEVWNFELESEILRSATRQDRGILKF